MDYGRAHGNDGKQFRHKNFGKFNKKQSVKLYRKKKDKKFTEKEEIQQLEELYEKFDINAVNTFEDFPLSTKTHIGLKESGFSIPTEIQKESIGLALKGMDILGAAKTGSGKTLAFLIPVLERLHREIWTRLDGLGALIITPTRELAYQIFEVLKKIGNRHEFSAGLVIGGKDLKFERKRMNMCNIVICTPGRLLQHMDENPLFECINLKILVLDEADRILDMGFRDTMNAIIENLPLERQTLLFSATQTKCVKDLARLSLKNPVYVSVHENAKFTTPEALQQSYIVCDLHDKLNLLWSFIKNHLKQKILIFVSSCKQVKYIDTAFCRMRPGVSVLALHGMMHQLKRMAVYNEFCRKQRAVLIATDIAARGLDFPVVNWVVQLDCPEDVNTYIHRAGRTARLEKDGESLLVLLPSEEESMVKQLQDRKIPINKIRVNPKMFSDVQRKLEALCARDVTLKEKAQRCFTAYLKSVFLMRDKTVFDVLKFDLEAFARSLGLAFAPRVRFLQKYLKAKQQNAKQTVAVPPRPIQSEESSESQQEEQEESQQEKKAAFQALQDDSDSEEDIFAVKKTITYDSDGNEEVTLGEPSSKKKSKNKPLTKVAVAKKFLKKKIKANKKILFDDEGKPIDQLPNDRKPEGIEELEKQEDTECGINLEISKKIMEEQDKVDKQLFRERIKAKHRAQRLKLKEERRQEKAGASLPKDEDEEVGKSSSEEEYNPLFDDLPDPDSVYGNKEDQSEDSDSESSEDSREKSKPPKKKLKREVEEEESDSEKPLDTGLDLMDDEELALHLLSKR